MRRFALTLLAACCVLGAAGCLLAPPTWVCGGPESTPNARMLQLVNQSEDHGPPGDADPSYWMADQPSHITCERVLGGVAPN